jgi:hypothetical protein
MTDCNHPSTEKEIMMANREDETKVSTAKRTDEKGSASRHAGEDADTPRLPHERDEGSFEQTDDGKTDSKIKRAYDDIAEGQIDTDRRGMPGVEEVERGRPSHKQPDIPESSRMPASIPADAPAAASVDVSTAKSPDTRKNDGRKKA